MTQFNGIKSTFLGVSMQQHPETIQAFNQLLNTVNLARIIELGTGEGGLTLFLGIYNYHRNWDCILRTYDKTALSSRNPRCYGLLRFLNVLVDRGDVLNDNRLIENIKDIIATDGTTLLICDNGDKEREFNLYAPSLKNGDIVMVHDYVAKGKEHVWGFPEVNIKNVMGTCVKYNLKPFMQSMFDEVAWLCRMKVADPPLQEGLSLQITTREFRDCFASSDCFANRGCFNRGYFKGSEKTPYRKVYHFRSPLVRCSCEERSNHELRPFRRFSTSDNQKFVIASREIEEVKGFFDTKEGGNHVRKS